MGIMLPKPVTEKETEFTESKDGLKFGASAMQGWRVDMEDTHTILVACEGLDGHSFVAVYDGHGGAAAAQYAGANMMTHVTDTDEFKRYVEAPEKDTKLLEKAMHNAFLAADSAIRKRQESSEGDRSGCTAMAAFITPTHMVFAHAGDSRALVASGGEVTMSTADHKPHNPEERDRIMKAGGCVSMKRVDGDLAVSRALGDFQYKDKSLKPEDYKVTPVPTTQSVPRSDKDEFLVLACDGIWDVMTNQDCAEEIRKVFLEGETRVEMACEEMLDLCLERKSRDNMSIVLVTFPWLKTGEGGGVAIRRELRAAEDAEYEAGGAGQEDGDAPPLGATGAAAEK